MEERFFLVKKEHYIYKNYFEWLYKIMEKIEEGEK